MRAPSVVMLKLARAACVRGASHDAINAIDATISILETPAPTPSTVDVVAMTPSEFAKQCSYSGRHVARLIRRGEVVTIGKGRGLRVLVRESIDKLRTAGETIPTHGSWDDEASAPTDPIERQGWEAAKRRARLRIVPGGE